jgi:NAD(P)-dependent dehydrogenase (short-subunit alcohol dehydrogenase family)
MSKRSGLEQNCAGIITGASSGIGKAMSLELARKYKASLIICARSADDLRKTKDEVENSEVAPRLFAEIFQKITICPSGLPIVAYNILGK